MVRFIRRYSIASLAGIVIAAVAMVVIFRAVLIHGITAIAESSSVASARIALHPILPYLVEYLENAATPGRDVKSMPLPAELAGPIADLMRDSHVARVKIYNRGGVVAFSTSPDQVGNDQSANPGFAAAMSGRVSVKLVYRDTFNPFDQTTEDDNLVQTYFPVRRRPTDPVVGVFEMYTDVDALVIEAERFELRMIAATALILALLYGGLLMLVSRMHELIESQQRTIREKNAVLEQLSRDSMRREEGERKKLATDLHEGLAQTLSAVKLAVENARGDSGPERLDSLESVIPDLQDAIGQVRTIAMDLRPPSLDELGLGPTLDALCRNFEEDSPGFRVHRDFAAHELAVPAPLKIVVYRIVESLLKLVRSHHGATEARIGLEAGQRALTLLVEDDAGAVAAAMREGEAAADSNSYFNAVRERATFSSGKLGIVKGALGMPALRVSWRL